MKKKSLIDKYKITYYILYILLVVTWVKFRIINLINMFYKIEYYFHMIFPGSLLLLNIYWLFKILMLSVYFSYKRRSKLIFF